MNKTGQPSEQRTKETGVPGWIYGLFFLSGISGLMYEVVWLRMLTRVLGVTVYATATVLAAFMAGLALGSYLVGRFIDRSQRPLLWYAFLELGIGVSALMSLWLPDTLLPVYRCIYEVAGSSRAWLTAGQTGIALAVLLVPTALMGATLPTLCAFGVRRHGSLGQYLGMLYGVNTLGAVLGVLASGFILIGLTGERNTILLGVGLNLAAAFGAFLLAPRPAPSPQPLSPEYRGEGLMEQLADQASLPSPPLRRRGAGGEGVYPGFVRRIVLVSFAVGGFAALANEVIWSRMLVLYQGTSVYAFGAMLAVMLAGMGVGSLWGGKFVDRWPDRLRQLAFLQLATGLAAVIALHLFDLGGTAKPDLASGGNLLAISVAPLLLLGPLGVLWGLTFPVAARCYMAERATAGWAVSRLYAWNTVGCIAGALIAGFGLIPLLGASHSGAIMAATSFVLGLLLLGIHPQGFWKNTGLLGAGLAGAFIVLLLTVRDPYYQVIRNQLEQIYPGRALIHWHVEEAAGSTTAFGGRGSDPRAKQLWVNGEGQTALVTATKLMAHLPLWLAEDPHDMLVVCFGMGTTAR